MTERFAFLGCYCTISELPWHINGADTTGFKFGFQR